MSYKSDEKYSEEVIVQIVTFFSLSLYLSGKLGGQDSFESIESFESCDRLTQSWSSQSSFSSLQRVPSYDSFDSEDYPTALHGHKPKGTFKDYVRERSDLSKDKPVIPAAALAGYTGKRSCDHSLYNIILYRVAVLKVM